MTIDVETMPATTEELCQTIVQHFPRLSKRLQQIGRYVLDHPNDIALETLAVISDRCGVQPSAIVRFAKSFGFDGASQMQRLFRDDLLNSDTGPGYAERVRRLNELTSAGGSEPPDLLAEFIEGNRLALQQLLEMISEADMRATSEMIRVAETVVVVGYRRSFPIASYLVYSLLQVGKRVTFIDGVGGLGNHQAERMTARDLLIAISFHPYAEETVAIVEKARASGAAILAISDSLVSPVAAPAELVLQVRESEVRGFRSLSASMCLAQAIAINFAFTVSASDGGATERAIKPPRKR